MVYEDFCLYLKIISFTKKVGGQQQNKHFWFRAQFHRIVHWHDSVYKLQCPWFYLCVCAIGRDQEPHERETSGLIAYCYSIWG